MTNQDMMCYLFKRNKWFHGIKAYKFIDNGVYLRGLNNTVSNEFNKNVKKINILYIYNLTFNK